MNRIARSNRKQDVLSFARERAWQPRGGSNAPVELSANQRPLERLEAENAQLRRSVVELVLQIQALRDGAR
jgi:cell division protein FtsB